MLMKNSSLTQGLGKKGRFSKASRKAGKNGFYPFG
jgi:hypothetical protein